MKQYIIYRGSKRLSGFYPNDISGVFAFRLHDRYSFDTKKEAIEFIQYIKKEVKNKNNIRRWGSKYTKQHQSVARNLKIYIDEY